MRFTRDTRKTYIRTRKSWITRRKKEHWENTNQEKAGSYIDIRENRLQEKTLLWSRKLFYQLVCDLFSFPRMISVFVLSSQPGTRSVGWYHIISTVQSTRLPLWEKNVFWHFLAFSFAVCDMLASKDAFWGGFFFLLVVLVRVNVLYLLHRCMYTSGSLES